MTASPPRRPLSDLRVRIKDNLTPRTTEERNILYLYLATAMVGIEQAGAVAYLPVFLARLGASAQEIGWLTSIPAVLTMLLLIPTSFLVERAHDHVRLRNRYTSFVRLQYLVLALAPLAFATSALPTIAIVLWVIRTPAAAISNTAFMTVLSGAIPSRQRPRVNSTRWALLSTLSALLAPLMGSMLDAVVFPVNYQILLALSFLGGLANTHFFSKIVVAPLKAGERRPARQGRLRQGVSSYLASVRKNARFSRFVLSTAIFRVAISMPAALFSLYWVNELHATDGLLGFRQTAAYISLVVGYVAWGRVARRIDHRLVLTGAAVLTAAHAITTGSISSAGWLIPVAILSGLGGSATNIGLFDMLLATSPREDMPRLSSIYNVVANGAAFLGPMLGVALSEAVGLRTSLLVIGGIQLLSMAAFPFLPRGV